MATDAQLRATNKYRKENVKQILIRFYPKEEDVYKKAKELGSPGIKDLIRDSK